MTAAPTQEKSIIGVGWIDPKFSFEGDHFIYSFREGGAHSSTAYRQYFENDSLMTTFDTLSLDTIDKLLLDLSKSSILESIFEAKEEIQGESNEQVVSLQLPTLNLYQLFKSLFIASFRLVLDSLDGQVTTNNEESKKFTENLSNTFPSDRQVLLENWTPFSNILYPLTIAFIYSKGGCQKPKIAKWELSDYYCPETMMTDSPPLQLYYKCPISKLLRWMQLKDKSFSIEAEQYLHFFLTEPQYNILFPPDEASNTSPNVGSCFETTSLFSLTFTVESLIQLLENGFQNLEIYKKLYCANIFPLNTLSDGSINSKLKVSFRKQLTEMYYDSLYSLPNSLVDCLKGTCTFSMFAPSDLFEVQDFCKYLIRFKLANYSKNIDQDLDILFIHTSCVPFLVMFPELKDLKSSMKNTRFFIFGKDPFLETAYLLSFREMFPLIVLDSTIMGGGGIFTFSLALILNPQYHEEILNTIMALKVLKTWKLLLPSSFFEGLKAKIDLLSSTAAYTKKKESIDEKDRLLELLEKLSPYHHATSKFASRLDTLIDFQNISHDRNSLPSLNRNKSLNAQEMEFLYAAYHHLALKYRYFVLVDDIPKPYYNLAIFCGNFHDLRKTYFD